MTRITIVIAAVAALVAGGAAYYGSTLAQRFEDTNKEMRASQKAEAETLEALARELRELRQQRMRSGTPQPHDTPVGVQPADDDDDDDEREAETVTNPDPSRKVAPHPLRKQILERYAAATGEAKEDALEELVELAKFGDHEAIGLIVEVLADEDEGMRANAIEAIGELANPEMIPHLEAAMADPSAKVRKEAAAAFSEMPPELVKDQVLGFLGDKDKAVLEEAIETALTLGIKEATALVLPYADHDDIALAAQAGEFLRSMGDVKGATVAMNKVAVHLEDPDPLTRLNALRLVRKAGGEMSIPLLKKALDDEAAAVREKAARELAILEGDDNARRGG